MNTLGIVKRNIERAPQEVVGRLRTLGVATVHEAMGRAGLTQPVLAPIYEGWAEYDLASTFVKWADRFLDRPGTDVQGTSHFRYQTRTHGAGMITAVPITATMVRQVNSRMPKSIDSGPSAPPP